MSHQSHKSGRATSDWLIGAVKNNPEGLLLLAAGCALMLRSGGSIVERRMSGQRAQSTSYGGRDWQYESNSRRQNRSGSGITESMSQAADSAREYASDMGRTVSEKTSAYASAIGDYADDARRTVADQSGRLVDQAQGTFRHMLQEQPLALAVLGLAAGAAVAAALPATAIERQTLGPAGERLSEVAASTGEQLREAASKAGEKLMDVADERGLNSDGLKEAASDVADAFGSAFRGEQGNEAGQGSMESRSGQSSSRQPSSGQSSSGQQSSGQSSSRQPSSGQSSSGQSSSGQSSPGARSPSGRTS
jgi:hypothetical protein